MQMAWNENHILLSGIAVGMPKESHRNHGVTYYQFPLQVERLSGAADVLHIITAQPEADGRLIRPGEEVMAEGEVRSYNNRTGVGSRLVITVYARALSPGQGAHKNELALAGVLCKPPVLRRTPLGREICDMMLAVNRKYGRADYLPCIAWGGLAGWCARQQVGDGLKLTGRLQSRDYFKEEDGQRVRRTAFEVSVMSMEPAEA